MTELNSMSGPQITKALNLVGLGHRAKMHGNVYNLIRGNNISGAIGTLMAGASPASHEKKRKALRRALQIVAAR